MQKQILSAFRSGGCEEYEDDRESSLFSAEMRKFSNDRTICSQQFQREPKKN